MEYQDINMTYESTIKPNDWIVEKLVKLQSILNEAHNKRGRHVPQKDRSWVLGFTEEIDNGMIPEKADLEKVNKLWKEYR